ncbi:MAG: MotA/TolQ/ExbB proton channel family protein [Vulcanimicrobiota bacterium]
MEIFQNFVSILNQGGFSMYLLVLASFIAIALIAERIYNFNRLYLNPEKLFQEITPLIKNQEYEQAREILHKENKPIARIYLAGLQRRGYNPDIMENSILNTINEELAHFEKNINILGTISVISPFLGLLGTILGMIKAFADIAAEGTTGPAVIATGVYEALYTTAAGLIIAIVTVIFYNYFQTRIIQITREFEIYANKTVEILKEKINNDKNLPKK